jgi:hypothetical protein
VSSRAWCGSGLERVDVDAHECVGILGCDLLDLDAALRREHEQGLPGAAVEGAER